MMSLINLIAALIFAPLIPGIINRTKAIIAGRDGQPLLQCYYDIFKLLQKGACISKTTTWVFAAGPAIALASVLLVSAIIPFGKANALLSFSGDFILFAYLLGLGRFFTVLAALDTGSAFEGMGASREMQFSTLAEVAFLLAIAGLSRLFNSLSLSEIFSSSNTELWLKAGPALVLIGASLFILLLAENSRIPVDDPATHLELTMIHEVMVLDHGGPDLALITYGAALKLWIFSALLVGIMLSIFQIEPWLGTALQLAGMVIVAIIVGLVESSMARLKLMRVPQLLVVAGALSLVALVITFSFEVMP